MMATAKRERRDRRDEVHGAAIEVFCAKGFAAASIQDVADAVGVLKGSLYHYISSKDDLLERIFEDAAQESQRRIDVVAALQAEPAERLRTFVERQVGWHLEHVEHATVLLREWRYLQGRQRKVVARHRRVYETFLRELIEDCVRAGVTSRDLDVAHALRFVLGAIDATPEWYRRSGADPPAHVARVYADLTLGAVLGAALEPNAR